MGYKYLHNIKLSVKEIEILALGQIMPKSTKTIERIEINNATKLTLNKTKLKLTMESKHNKLLKSFGNQSLDNIFSDLNINRLEGVGWDGFRF